MTETLASEIASGDGTSCRGLVPEVDATRVIPPPHVGDPSGDLLSHPRLPPKPREQRVIQRSLHFHQNRVKELESQLQVPVDSMVSISPSDHFLPAHKVVRPPGLDNLISKFDSVHGITDLLQNFSLLSRKRQQNLKEMAIILEELPEKEDKKFKILEKLISNEASRLKRKNSSSKLDCAGDNETNKFTNEIKFGSTITNKNASSSRDSSFLPQAFQKQATSELENKRIPPLSPSLQAAATTSSHPGERRRRAQPATVTQKSENCKMKPGKSKVNSNDFFSDETESMDMNHINVVRRLQIPELRLGQHFPKSCPISLNGVLCSGLLDSGNLCSNVISSQLVRKLGLSEQDIEPISDLPVIGTAKSGSQLKVKGVLKRPLKLRFGSLNTFFHTRPIVCDGLSMGFNISGPFMKKIGLDQLHSSNSIRICGQEIPMERKSKTTQSGIYIAEDVKIPPQSGTFVRANIAEIQNNRMQCNEGLVIAHLDFAIQSDLVPTPRSLVKVSPEGITYVAVLNTSPEDVPLARGTRYGTFCLSSDMSHSALSGEEACSLSPPSINQLTTPSGNKALYRPSKKSFSLRQKMIKEFRLEKSPFLKDPRRLNKVVDLLMKYSSVVSFNEEYGKTDLVEHSIDTGDAPPIKVRDRPLNPSLESNLKAQLEHWLDQDIIEPSMSPWSFPLVPVQKKVDLNADANSITKKLNVRYAIDYRKINDITRKDAFPMPNVEDNLARLSKSRIFSTLDNVGAYYSIPISETDREKTAFSAGPFGLFQFKRLPNGLCNAPSCYNRLIRLVLQGVGPEIALIFLDDVIVHSATFEEQLINLEIVLQAYQKAGLKLKPSKTHLFQEQVDYLGHRISQEGVGPIPDYVKIVQDWPEPSSLRDVRTFLGKVSYYRKFIRNYSAIASPLTAILSQDHPIHQVSPFSLTQAAKDAFCHLKQALVEAPILAYPQFDSQEKFILDTDFSNDPGAIGGVLSQVQDGQERVIMYGARKLNKSEKSYSSNKGELLAILHFINKWKYYLQFRPFILRTDHHALTYLRTMKEEPRGMIARWIQTLANFDFEVKHRKGTSHGNADALSRCEHAPNPCPHDPEVTDDKFLSRPEYTFLSHPDDQLDGDDRMDVCDKNSLHVNKIEYLPSSSLQELKEDQSADNELAEVIAWVREGKLPPKPELRSKSLNLQTYASLFNCLELNPEGILVRRPLRHEPFHRERHCVPKSTQIRLISFFHERNGGHMGIKTTYHRMCQQVYFPNMIKRIELFIRGCQTCQRKSGRRPDQRHTLRSVRDGYPWARISCDLVGPLPPSSRGNHYIFTMKCCFTKWLEAVPISEIDSEEIVRSLQTHIFSRYGMPSQYHTDRGSQLTSSLLQEILQLLGVKQTMTPAYNPKSSPVERSHRDLKMVLKALMEDDPEGDWEEHLPAALLALRTARHRHTGFTPHFLLFGREAVLPVNLIYGHPPGPQKTSQEYADHTFNIQQKAFEIARENLGASIERAKLMYTDLEKRPLQVTDLVWLFTPKVDPAKSKFSTFWTGPYEITERHNPVLFTIQNRWSQTKSLTLTVGVDRLKRYFGTPPQDYDTARNVLPEDVTTTDEFLECHPQVEETTVLRPRVVVSTPETPQEVFIQDIADTATQIGAQGPPSPIFKTSTPKPLPDGDTSFVSAGTPMSSSPAHLTPPASPSKTNQTMKDLSSSSQGHDQGQTMIEDLELEDPDVTMTPARRSQKRELDYTKDRTRTLDANQTYPSRFSWRLLTRQKRLKQDKLKSVPEKP